MDRSKPQVLFNFLPDDTFDHAETGIIGQVSSIGKDRSAGSFPKRYFIQRIESQMGDWENDPSFREGNVEIVSPSSVEFEVFPLTFECSTCGKLTQIDKESVQGANLRGGIPCGNDSCSATLSGNDQLQFVKVCPCGSITSLYVPENGVYELNRSNRGLASSTLEGPNNLRELGDVGGGCFECDTGPYDREVKVHSASSCFYPQRATFVNTDREDINRIRDNTHFQTNVLVDYLSAEGDQPSKSPGEELDDTLKQALNKIGTDAEQVKEAVADVKEERQEKRADIRDFVEDEFPEDLRQVLSEEVFEFQALGEDSDDLEVYSKTLADLRDKAAADTSITDASDMATVYDQDTIESFLTARDSLGFSQVRLMENFPVTTAIYGYSRLHPSPADGTRLNKFSGKYGTKIYALTAEAEAVQFTLDHATVYKWLQLIDGIDIEDTVDVSDKYELRQWFLEKLTPPSDPQPIPRHQDISQSNPVRHAVVTLLHSYAHVLINSIDALSGYSRESLVEYLLPRPLSFIVYKRSDTDFSLGAIFTLIEDRFDEVAEQIRTEEQDCLYDPVCKHEDGHACEGCLYVSNLSCEYQNHTLSRAPLYGGDYRHTTFTGYLDTAAQTTDD